MVFMEEKACTGCGVSYPISMFNKKGSGRSTRCKKCVAEYYRNYYHGSEERKAYVKRATKANAEKNKYKYLANKYNSTEEHIKSLFDANDGLCAICKVNAAEHLDHDHTTNVPRGYLCRGCNHGLGNFRDNVEYLASAIKYLNSVTSDIPSL